MGDTAISWTHRPGTRGRTWNPVRGCSRVSEGCRHCYAEAQAARIVRMGRGKPTAYDGLVKLVGGEPRWTGEVRLVADHLADPLRWREPTAAFVNSMSDLFHESLSNEQIAAVFGVMAACPQHTFQILTKRAKRMREWFAWVESTGYAPGHVLAGALEGVAKFDDSTDPRFVDDTWLVALTNVVHGVSRWHHDPRGGEPTGSGWPPPNVWLGVSVENQEAADERIPELLKTPAKVQFLSCEPLLGPVDLEHVVHRLGESSFETGSVLEGNDGFGLSAPRNAIDWVIAGCESGPGARTCGVEWLRSLRDQCAAAEVPFFLKQAMQPGSEAVGGPLITAGAGSKRKAGGVVELPYLDGVQHAAFPDVLAGGAP